ncbi:MAG: isoprenylcysteine carboxylmethyltransferase family protein [Pseudomonadota bacterium]
MKRSTMKPLRQLLRLGLGIFRTPAPPRQLVLALAYGVLCHSVFATAVIAMIVAMFYGLSESFGTVPAPWSILVNLALILQFPLMHSFLLSKRGGACLVRLAPKRHGSVLATTTYAIIASLQLLALFALWTPSGIIWWQAEGIALVLMTGLYGMSWLLLIWASYDAGAEVQSGALGWMSLAQRAKPVFPAMPTRGLFSIIRQPIYVSFALTTWTVPTWSPDQLLLAIMLTAYCLGAPVLKERRFTKRYGAKFEDYQKAVPYAVPHIAKPARPIK